MKIGIITLFHNNYNYGAVLQAFALQKTLEAMGHKASVIDYERSASAIDSASVSFSAKVINKLKSIKSYGDIINLPLLPYTKKCSAENKADIEKRKEKFNDYYKRYMSISDYYNIATIITANNDFDAFVCGSDQIWRPTSFDKNYYLSFADKRKLRFSYAASIGVKELSERQRNIMLPLINSLDAVSVREEEAKDLIAPYCSKGVNCVLDPTLLMNTDFWLDKCKTPDQVKGKKYIFSYMIGESSKNREIVKRISKLTGMPIVTIPGISRVLPYDFSYADINITDASPNEFLGLINNAQLVLTDSFHACVFSIHFEKCFFALERFKSSDKNSMNGRLYDLLSMFSLNERIITQATDLKSLDFKAVPKIAFERFENKKKVSLEYLKASLEIKKSVSDCAEVKLPCVYACQTTNTEVRKKSSSGGVFFALAQRVLSEGGKIVACRMDENATAIHDVCSSVEELYEYMGSKYVQSRIGDAFIKTAEFLKDSLSVMFVGTPCQVQGLLNYLKAKNVSADGLLTVDFVCHGVPSPKVWRSYVESICKKPTKGKMKYSFRDKELGWRRFSLVIKDFDKTLYRADKDRDYYIKGFLNDIYLRPSCYNCRFKSVNHNSDITLADFWHFEKVRSDIVDNDTGVSLVFTHSPKGEEYLKSLDGMAIESVPCEVVAAANRNMLISAKKSVQREKFFENEDDLSERNIVNHIKRSLNDTFAKRVFRICKRTVKRVIRR